MKRIIKFRAWDNHVDEMVYPLVQNNHKGWFLVHEILSTYPIERVMQFTGLKDKNGKDIYESDILAEPGDHTKHDYKYVVEYVDGWFVGQPDYKNPIGGYKNFQYFNQCEIIGNIHQDLELLDK